MTTWNIPSCRNKTYVVIAEIEKIITDITVLTETKNKGQGSEDINRYVVLYSGVNKD